MTDDARRIYQSNLNELLAEAKRGDRDLAALYDEVTHEIVAKVRARGDNTNSIVLEADIDEAFKRRLFQRMRVIKTQIESGAQKGPQAARKTFRATYGEDTTKAMVRSSKRALTQAADRIAGRTTVDNVTLSKRIRGWDRKLGREMAVAVEQGIKSKKGILAIAKKIERLDDGFEAHLPKYLEEVEWMARRGNLDELKKLTKRYKRYALEKLGEMQADGTLKASKYSLRSTTQKFLRDIEKSGPEGVDRVVKEYVKGRAEYQARLIARHESVQAFRRSYIEQSKGKPGVIGYRWMLSNRHPRPDECDLLANANQHGLGPGVFPVDKVPMHPHPACICSTVAVMDRDHFKRAESEREGVPVDMRDTKSPDAVGWLEQNEQVAAKILGPTRHALMKQGVNVLDGEGRPLRVRDVLGSLREAAE